MRTRIGAYFHFKKVSDIIGMYQIESFINKTVTKLPCMCNKFIEPEVTGCHNSCEL